MVGEGVGIGDSLSVAVQRASTPVTPQPPITNSSSSSNGTRLSPTATSILSSYAAYKANEPAPQPKPVTVTPASTQIAKVLTSPANPPSLDISAGNLAKSDALRATLGLPPLEKEETVHVVAPTPGPGIPIKLAPGESLTGNIQPIRTITEPTLSPSTGASTITDVESAYKTSVGSPLPVESKLVSVSVPTTDLHKGPSPEVSSMIGTSVSKNAGINLGFGAKINIPKSITDYGSSIIDTLKTRALQVGAAFAQAPHDVIQDITTGALHGKEQSENVQKTVAAYGGKDTFVDTTLSGKPYSGSTSSALGSLTGDILLALAPAKLPKIGSIGTAGTVKGIGAGLREGSLEYKTEVQKGSDLGVFEQGTEGLSKNVNSAIARIVTGINKAGQPITSKLPPIAENIKSIIGIGPKGEKVNVPQGAQVKLPNPEGEGIAKNPLAFIEPKGLTSIVKSDVQDVLKPTHVLIDNLEENVAKNLGLTKVPGTNSYVGKVTSENVAKLEGALKANLIKPVSDILSFPTSEVKKAPALFGKFAETPELLKGKDLLGNPKFPDVTRPAVTRYYVSKNVGIEQPTGVNVGTERSIVKNPPVIERGGKVEKPEDIGSKGLDRILSDLGLSTGKEPKATKSFRQYKPSDFQIGTGKGGAGSSGKAKTLSQKNIDTIKAAFIKAGKTEGAKTKVKSDVLGPINITGGETTGRGKQKNQETGSTVIAYPPGTDEKLIGKSKGLSGYEKLGMSDVLNVDKLTGLSNVKASDLSHIGLTDRLSVQRELNKIKTEGLGLTDTVTVQKTTGKTKPILDTSGLGITDTVTVQKQTPTQGQKQQSDLTSLLDQLSVTKTPGEKPPKDIPYFSIPLVYFPSGIGGPSPRIVGHRRKRGFAVYSVNPENVGAIAQEGLPGLSTSGSEDILDRVDKQLALINKRNFGGKTYLDRILKGGSGKKKTKTGKKSKKSDLLL